MKIDHVLMFLAACIVAFTIAVLYIFAQTGGEPSTLVASVFALATAEAAICWQIHAKRNGLSDTDVTTDVTTDIAGDIVDGLDLVADVNDEETVG